MAKPRGRPKGIPSTEAERKAGAHNLKAYKEKNPYQANFRHGAHSNVIKRRYADGRTTEGKALNRVMDSLVNDLGGPTALSAAQLLVLDNIRSKLIVLFQIGQFVERQDSIIDSEGNLLPCLGRGYTRYSESLRKDLEVLFKVKRKSDSPSYEKAMRALQEDNSD